MEMAGGHSRGGGEKPSSIMSGDSGISSLDPWSIIKGDMPLAIARFLASSLDPEGVNAMHTVEEDSCEDCIVLAAKMDAVFENRTRADVSSGVYLHHIFTMNIAERLTAPNIMASWVPFCAGSKLRNEMVSALQTVQGFFRVKTRMDIFGFSAVDEFKQ
jgi:hypothetical protein